MNHITLRIKEVYEELDLINRKIAEFMLEDMDRILELSISKLSEETNTSQAAWVRFCKVIGYSGLKELKKDYILNVIGQNQKTDEDKKELVYTDIQGFNCIEDIIASVSELNERAVHDTRLILDAQAIDEAVEMLSATNRILFLGMGASGIVAQDAAYKFSRIGCVSQALLDFHMQITTLSLLTPEDVAVFISYSGRTKEMVEMIHLAKNVGCKTICVTKFGTNLLNEMADIKIGISAPEIEKRSGATGSRIAQLNVIDILFTGVANRKYDSIKETLEKTAKIRLNHRL